MQAGSSLQLKLLWVLAAAVLAQPTLSVASSINPERSVMIWLLGSPGSDGSFSNATAWQARMANIKAHKENVSEHLLFLLPGLFQKTTTSPR